MMENKTKILIISPVALIIIFILTANSIHFKEEASESEVQRLKFTPVDIKIKQGQGIHAENNSPVSKDFESPIDFNLKNSHQDSFPPVALDDLLPHHYNGKGGLSLIVISGKSRMAVIKGIVVKEGDNIGEMKVAKIKSDRVLLKNKTTQWLYLKKIK